MPVEEIHGSSGESGTRTSEGKGERRLHDGAQTKIEDYDKTSMIICKDILFQKNHSSSHPSALATTLTSFVIQSLCSVLLLSLTFFFFSNVNADSDECAVSGSCGLNTLCVNSVGSYSCSCHSGYRVKINELNCIGNC